MLTAISARVRGSKSLGLFVSVAGVAGGYPEPITAQHRAEPASCELHIFPTNKYAATENLGGANLGLAGAFLDEATKMKSPESVVDQFKHQLSPSEQERIIKDVEPTRIMQLPEYKTVIEPAENQPIWTPERLKSNERISNSTSPCLVEMAIISQQYMHQVVGTRLRTFIWYAEFSGSTKPKVKVIDTTATKAPNFPAKNVDDVTASMASVQAAFRENLLKFVKDKLKR